MSDSESGKAERSKMRYPKGRMVVVRDSTVPVCNNNNPGAVLLSTLLFWYDNPWKLDTYQEEEQTFTMCRTQSAIEEQACHQIDVKTIHDTAVPLLQLLGYLTVKEKMNGNIYILHMDRIFAAYAAYEQGTEKLKSYLKASLQLESAPIKMSEAELESALINRRGLYLQLERVLIVTRADSHCQRGRKPKPHPSLEGNSQDTENLRESIEKKREESGVAVAPPAPPQSESETHSQQEVTRTCDTCGRPQTEADCPWCMTTRLPAIPKAVGGTSHEQNRDARQGNVAVETGLGAVASAPGGLALPESSSPRMKSATVASPPPQVLVVSQQFSSLEEWKEAQEAFVETLRGIWKTAAPDFKKACGTWNIYRKQYLDRWLRANPMPGEVQFTQDGKALFDEWCSLFKVKVDAGKVTIEAANWLAERLAPWVDVLSIPRTDLLRDFKGWCYTNDKKGYYTRGVKLFDLRREFEGWQSYQQSLLDKAVPARPQNKYGTVSGLPRLEIDPEWLAAVEGR